MTLRMTRQNSLVLCALVACLGINLMSGERIDWSLVSTPAEPDGIVLWNLRLPRALFAAVIGGMLAVIGASYQSIFQNPLAEPFVFGATSIAAFLLVALQMFLGLPPEAIPSSIIATVATLSVFTPICLFLLAQRDAKTRVLLFGMGINFVFSSLLFLLLSYHSQSVGAGSMRWLFGQIPWATWQNTVGMMALSALVFGVLLHHSRALDVLSFGDSTARALGISPRRVRAGILMTTTAWLALSVSLTGSIGFVGLVIPHVSGMLFSTRSSGQQLLLSFGLGASFLTLCDGVSRALLPPLEFPVGILTTLIGGPIFLWLLVRNREIG